jgi:tRNA nucleotidyltransferase (CCA-adding enzyme)
VSHFQVYTVGGWVRDQLLARSGYPVVPGDRDWVVVGATPAQLQALGYLPVGRDFPVFLHPQTREEYALARTERKTAAGYHGFVFQASPDVTLEQDLARRDLSINAMAMDAAGQLFDPLGGVRDLQARVLRHVGPAFVEDPVRVLRLARFAARFADFTVAPETLALCREMAERGEIDALVPERVGVEVARGLMEARPARMLEVLLQGGALQRLAPQLDVSPGRLAALEAAARAGAPLAVRLAVLAASTPQALEGLRPDTASRQLCALYVRLHTVLRQLETDADAQCSCLEQADALRRPERWEQLLQVAQLLDGMDPAPWRAAAAAARSVDAGAIARAHGPDGSAIAAELARARRAAVAAAAVTAAAARR